MISTRRPCLWPLQPTRVRLKLAVWSVFVPSLQPHEGTSENELNFNRTSAVKSHFNPTRVRLKPGTVSPPDFNPTRVRLKLGVLQPDEVRLKPTRVRLKLTTRCRDVYDHFNPTRVRLKPSRRPVLRAILFALQPHEGTSETESSDVRWRRHFNPTRGTSETALQPHEGLQPTKRLKRRLGTRSTSVTSTPRGYV